MSGNLDKSNIEMFLDELMSSEHDRYGGNYGELENYSGSEFSDLEDIGNFINVDSVFSTDDKDAMAENENALFDDELEEALDIEEGRRSRKNCKICYNKAKREGGHQALKNLKKVTTFFELCP
ncbi:hypothetical protein J6590_064006 [Homalodisca vitripennis]|nr:hypothetical protein J6590_064006 [Homalodisca vitripennis]